MTCDNADRCLIRAWSAFVVLRASSLRVVAEERDHTVKAEVMIRVEDVDAVLVGARAAGASDVWPSHDWEYGERQGGFVDPFGHTWVLTQTLRDTDPVEWGGQAVVPRTE